MENHEEVNTYHLNSDITCLSWTQNTNEITDGMEDLHDNRLVSSISSAERDYVFFFFYIK